MAETYRKHESTNRDDETGDVTHTTHEVHSDENGTPTQASSLSTTVDSETGAQTEVFGFTYFDEAGEPASHGTKITEKDPEGNVTKTISKTVYEDGTSVRRVENADGSVTITTYDKDGKETGTETIPPAKDDGKGEESSDFWDPDIVYGEPDLEILEFGKGGFDPAMVMSDDPKESLMGLDMMVDSFEFMM